MRLTLVSSDACTIADFTRRNFCFLVLLRIMCEVNAWKRFTLPDPVSLKRFFAPEWVFILGIAIQFFFKERKGKQLQCQIHHLMA